MAVISCKRARTSPTLKTDKQGRATLTVVWNVETSDPTDGPISVLNGARNIDGGDNDPVPPRGSGYAWPGETFGGVLLLEYDVQRRHDDRNRNLWTITATYSVPDPGQSPNEDRGDATTIPIKYRLEHVSFTEVVEEDKDGQPIVNAAEQEFDEPLEQEQSRLVLVAEKIFLSAQPPAQLAIDALLSIVALNRTFKHTVNDATFLGAGPREWFCHTIPASDMTIDGNGIAYRTATIRLELNPKKWDRKVLNRGFKHYKTAADKTLLQATTTMVQQDGTEIKVPTNEPVLLAADGTRLPDGQLGNFITFRVRRETDFDQLGI